MTQQEYQEYINKSDPTVLRALQVIEEGKAKPTAGMKY